MDKLINTVHINELKRLAAGSKLLENEPMSRHTTFKSGGMAEVYMEPEEEEAVKNIVDFCKFNAITYYIIGRGSNLLVSDRGLRGVVISTSSLKSILKVEEDRLLCSSGCDLGIAANKAMEHGLGGMEFASGIPGSVGGAIFMNAGAYGSEIKDILSRVRVIEKDGRIHTVSAEELELSYRHSNIEKLKRVILEAEFKLIKANKEDILAKMTELNSKRKSKQPLEYPSAGSTFKRPENHFAGKLIEEAGLRGYSAGGAAVSEKHCGFVINKNAASSQDIYDLIIHIQKKVRKASGVELIPEVRLLGKFD